jgi:hypothetical protein
VVVTLGGFELVIMERGFFVVVGANRLTGSLSLSVRLALTCGVTRGTASASRAGFTTSTRPTEDFDGEGRGVTEDLRVDLVGEETPSFSP